MAYIKVDHSKFDSAASAVEEYIDFMEGRMNSVQEEITTLSSSWQGTDFIQFKTEYDKVDNDDSTYVQMKKSLESYAKYLRYAANKYKDAQARAVNRANNLPRY